MKWGAEMDEKRRIIRSFIPQAVLKPMTEEALKAVPESYLKNGLIALAEFPFRIGRESRVRLVNEQLLRTERPKFEERKPNNDLYLVDGGEKLNISREHLRIEKVEGQYFIADRGSVCGIWIEDETIGGNGLPGRKKLNDGDVIHIGCNSTPYVYQFLILEEVWLQARDLADVIECFYLPEADEGAVSGSI